MASPTPTREVPPKPALVRAGGNLETPLGGVDDGGLHLLISELKDDNARSRVREAAWISIICHLVILFAAREMPRIWPARPVTLVAPELSTDKSQTVFLDQAPDNLAPKTPPPTNKISDKDRIAQARQPQLRPQEEVFRDNRRQGPPPAGQLNNDQRASAQPAQGNQQEPPRNNQRPRQEPANQLAEMRPPSLDPSEAFKTSATAGQAIEQAARASSQQRNQGFGDYGSGPASPNTTLKGNVDILSDTMGVDFSSYIMRVIESVKVNWYNLIPEVARAPLMKSGKVAVEFQINKDGSIGGMRLAGPSGDVSLDRAAWGGITASNPFPQLPEEYRGKNLALRFHFFYNPDRSAMVK